jgi:hypothetical protein
VGLLATFLEVPVATSLPFGAVLASRRIFAAAIAKHQVATRALPDMLNPWKIAPFTLTEKIGHLPLRYVLRFVPAPGSIKSLASAA